MELQTPPGLTRYVVFRLKLVKILSVGTFRLPGGYGSQSLRLSKFSSSFRSICSSPVWNWRRKFCCSNSSPICSSFCSSCWKKSKNGDVWTCSTLTPEFLLGKKFSSCTLSLSSEYRVKSLAGSSSTLASTSGRRISVDETCPITIFFKFGAFFSSHPWCVSCLTLAANSTRSSTDCSDSNRRAVTQAPLISYKGCWFLWPLNSVSLSLALQSSTPFHAFVQPVAPARETFESESVSSHLFRFTC